MIGLAFIIKAGFFIAGVVQAASAITEIKTAKVLEKNEVPQIDDSDIKNEEVKKQVKYLNDVSEEYTNNSIGLCKGKALLSAGISMECFFETYVWRNCILNAPMSFKLPFAIVSVVMVCFSLINYKKEIENYKEVKNAYKNNSTDNTDAEEINDYQEV